MIGAPYPALLSEADAARPKTGSAMPTGGCSTSLREQAQSRNAAEITSIRYLAKHGSHSHEKPLATL